MHPGSHRHHAMIGQARRASPNHHIAVLQGDLHYGVRPLRSAEQEPRWQAQRYRDDRSRKVALVYILMQSHLPPDGIAIDQTAIGFETGISRRLPRSSRQITKQF